MIRPIVLATDGSVFAAEATFEAFHLARALDAPLVAISVASIAFPPYAYAGNPEAIAALLVAESDRVAAVLTEVSEAAVAAGIQCTAIGLQGSVATQIRETAGARQARLIVVGAHGWGPVSRVIHGSVAQDLAENAPCPLLVVRPSPPEDHEGGAMKPILLATDGSPCAEGATLEAIELARAFGATLVVASVAHLVLPGYGGYYGYGEIADDLYKVETEHVAEVLATTRARIEEAGVSCETVALDGPASDEICRAAAEHQARLVVIGAHGWGRFGRIMHGSVSTAVLHDAPCPVLVVHGADEVTVAQPERETEVTH